MSHTTKEVLMEIAAERRAQDIEWGQQDHPNGTGIHFKSEDLATLSKIECKRAFKAGEGTWNHILTEEFLEAVAESDPLRLREELIQVAAVAAAWIEAIDRKTK